MMSFSELDSKKVVIAVLIAVAVIVLVVLVVKKYKKEKFTPRVTYMSTGDMTQDQAEQVMQLARNVGTPGLPFRTMF